MKVPPTTAITSPNTIYTTATFVPKILIKRIKLPRSTIGDEIKKEKVTPNGSPALVNPINKGIDDFLTSLWWKVTLNIGNHINQETEQYCNFQHIINKKLNTATKSGINIQSYYRKYFSYQLIEPLHPQHLILNKSPNHKLQQPPLSPEQDNPSINCLYSFNVSQFKE